MLRVDKLRNKKGGGSVGDGHTETDEETGRSEKLHVDTNRLQNNTENHNRATNNDTPASAEDIGGVWDDRKRADRTDGHDGVEETTRACIRTLELCEVC